MEENEDKKQVYFKGVYDNINKDLKPQYPVDKKYYSEQLIDGIDIISDCYTYGKIKNQPVYIVDSKEVTEQFIRDLKPEDVETVTVLKDKSAFEKYGEKGKNGVIEIKLKKK